MPVKLQAEFIGLERSAQIAAQRAGRNLKINLGTSAKSIEGLSQPLGRITGKADEFTKSMEAANARVLAFGASVAVINGVSQGFRNLVATTIEVEKSLANINSILKQNAAQINNFKKEIFDVARNTEQTFQATAEAALELSRQGLSATEVTKRLNDSLVLARISGLNAADAVAGLTAAINAFNSTGITSSEVLNKISAAAASAAVSDRDLIEALKRSGSVAVTTGVQFEELVGIVSALQEKTARGGAVIGNSLKTIFTRITTLDKLETLSRLGVQVEDLEGEVLSANKIIENLSVVFAKLSRAEKINLADRLVGKFQIAPFLALLEDFNSKVVRSAEVTEVAFGATNEAYQRNAALNKTLAALINETTINAKEFANALGEIGVTDSLKNILSFFSNVITRVKDVLEGEGVGGDFARGIVKGLSKVISGPGLAIFGAILAKLTVDLAKFGVGSLKTFFGLNKAAQAQATLQGQIASTLLSNKGIQQQILSIENSTLSIEQKRALQSKFFTDALNTQLGVMKRMQAISATIAPAVLRGTRGGVGRGSRASGGFLPVGAEKADISRGVGGAPSSAKPVVIPNFAFGGGKVGPIVANTSEYIIPNYAGGGDAIFNQNMVGSMGLPSNAKKIKASGGYIPNFRSPGRSFAPKGARARVNQFQDLVLFVGDRGSDESQDFTVGKKGGKTFAYTTPAEASKRGATGLRQVMVPTFRMKPRGGNKTPDDISKIKNKIAGAASGEAQRFAANLAAPAKLPTLTKKRIQGLFNPGSFEGFAGSTFEVAIASILESRQFADYAARTSTSRIDLPYSPRLFDRFGAVGKGRRGAEVKATGKTDLKKSAAVKFYDILVGGAAAAEFQKDRFAGRFLKKSDAKRLYGMPDQTYRAIQRDFGTVTPGTIQEYRQGNPQLRDPRSPRFIPPIRSFRNPGLTRGFAGGYIPNYSALDDAVARETSAGLPINQVRINQSGKLRNSQNPMGLAVTNTRDEPTGAIPNSARGFIPNYQILGPDGRPVGSTASSTSTGTASNNNLTKATKDATGKLIGLTIATSVLSSAFGGVAEEQEGGAKKLAEFGKGLTSVLTTMLLFQALGVRTSPLGLGAASRSAAAKGATFGAASRVGGARNIIGGNVVRGTLQRGFGRTLGVLGKAFGRLIPFIGPVVIGFQALNTILGGKLMDGLKKGLTSVGKALGIVKSPAEKAAEAMEKLTKEIFKNAAAQGFTPNTAKEFLDKIVGQAGERRAKEALSADQKRGLGTGSEAARQELLQSIFEDLGTSGARLSAKRASTVNLPIGFDAQGNQIQQRFNLGDPAKVDTSLLGAGGKVSNPLQLDFADAISFNKNDTFADRVTNLELSINRALDNAAEQFDDAFDNNKLADVVFDTIKGSVINVERLSGAQREQLTTARLSAVSGFATAEGRAGLVAAQFQGDEKLIRESIKKIEEGFNVDQIRAYKDLIDAILDPDDNQDALIKAREKFNSLIKDGTADLGGQASTNRELVSTAKARLLAQVQIRDGIKDVFNFEKDILTVESQLLTTSKARQDVLKGQADLITKQQTAVKKLADDSTNTLLEGFFGPDGKLKLDRSRIDEATEFISRINQEISSGQTITPERAVAIQNEAKALSLLDKKATGFAENLTIQSNLLEKNLNIEDARIKKQTFLNSLVRVQNDITKNNLDALERQLTVTSDLASETNRLEQARLDSRIADLEARKIGVGNTTARGVDEQIREARRTFLTEQAQRESGIALENLRRSLFNQARQISPELLVGDEGAGGRNLQQRLAETVDESGFKSVVDDLNEKQKEIQRKEIEDNFIQAKQALSILKTQVATANTNASSASIIFNAAKLIERAFDPTIKPLVDGGPLAGLGAAGFVGGKPVSGQAIPPVVIEGANLEKLEAERDRALAGLDSTKGPFNAIELQKTFITLEAISVELGNEMKGLNNALKEANASAITFANLLRDEFLNLDEDLARGLFGIATATTRGDLISQSQNSLRTLDLIQNPSLAGKSAAERATRSRQVEIDLARARGFAEQVGIVDEFRKTEELLALRDEMNEKGITTQEQIVELLKKAKELELERTSLSKELAKRLLTTEDEMFRNFTQGTAEAVVSFRDGLASGIREAIQGTGDLRDALLSAVTAFNTKLLDTSLNSIFGGISNAIGGSLGGFNLVNRNSGGIINGGSGVRDDVPALLTGGEFVINRQSVQKYGRGFFESLNAGAVPGFQNGGFFAPGLFGQGAISGKEDLLTFATQSFTSGGKDVRFGSGGVAAINLEPESVRLSNRGRAMGTPSQSATRDAKAQAFDLFVQQGELEERIRQEEKERKRQLRTQLITAGASLLLGSMAAGGIAANRAAVAGGGRASLSTFLQGTMRGGDFGGQRFGGLTNMFSSGLRGFRAGPSRAVEVKATGGGVAGVDTVPTMLTAGEFVMNNAATQNIGAGNLAALNAGSSSIVTQETAEQLNQNLISKLDEVIDSSGGMGDINITVNSDGGRVTQNGGEGNEANQNLARQIRDAVVNVIEQEKRLGGSLRRGLA